MFIENPEVHTSKTILLVDDDVEVLKATKTYLEKCGYAVLTAPDGSDALTILKLFMSPSPELIILDVEMPEMNGYTFLYELQKNPRLKHLPVIMVTAYGQMEPIFTLKGVRKYLIKPVEPSKLLEAIKEILPE